MSRLRVWLLTLSVHVHCIGIWWGPGDGLISVIGLCNERSPGWDFLGELPAAVNTSEFKSRTDFCCSLLTQHNSSGTTSFIKYSSCFYLSVLSFLWILICMTRSCIDKNIKNKITSGISKMHDLAVKLREVVGCAILQICCESLTYLYHIYAYFPTVVMLFLQVQIFKFYLIKKYLQ